MAGAVNALATTGLVFSEGPWRGIGDLGLATLGAGSSGSPTRGCASPLNPSTGRGRARVLPSAQFPRATARGGTDPGANPGRIIPGRTAEGTS